jgi:type II secretory pathway component GspD/PulD (secretin)
LYYVKLPGTDVYIIKDRRREPIIGVSKVIRCNYIKAEDLTEILKSRITQAGQIKADKLTNSLIVNDISEVVAEVEDIIKQLDVPTPQALIEAQIVEIKKSKDFKFGLGVNNLYNKDAYWVSPLEQKRGEVTKDFVQPEVNFQQIFGELFGVGGIIKTAIITEGVNIEGFIETMASKGLATVMARPKLLVMNNQESFIQIVEEVPYQRLTVSEEGKPLVSTEFKQVGVKLEVKPQINSDNSIVLKVSPEQSYRTGESLGGIPIIDTSKTNTTFLLKSGQTAVIGGLLREIKSKTDYKIPLLGDIPIIGYLFKRTVSSKTNSELTIFITATVVEKL